MSGGSEGQLLPTGWETGSQERSWMRPLHQPTTGLRICPGEGNGGQTQSRMDRQGCGEDWGRDWARTWACWGPGVAQPIARQGMELQELKTGPAVESGLTVLESDMESCTRVRGAPGRLAGPGRAGHAPSVLTR